MKAVWKGTISFGLVNIAIELYSAIKAETVGFTLLHKKDDSPVSYKRWCDVDNKEVKWDEIVKGIKLPNDTYFIITPSSLEKLKPKKTDSISIVEFVDSSAIEPIYYNHHYYVAPAKVTDRAFMLFLSVMQGLQLSAIGTFVLRDKEYVCAIKGYENGLLLSTLHYEYEIKKVAKFGELEKAPKIDIREQQLAEQLIKKLYVKKFDISMFKNTFMQDLLKHIKAQSKGIVGKKVAKQIPLKAERTLLDDLKASLESNTPKARVSKKKSAS